MKRKGVQFDPKITLGALLTAIVTLLGLLYAIFGTELKEFINSPKKQPLKIVGQDGVDMMLIPAGEFQMGSNDSHAPDNEQPIHTVYLDAFYMDIYEVTNAQYKAFVLANPQWQKAKINPKFHNGNYLSHWEGNTFPTGHGNQPVVYVSWYAAMAYAEWAGKRLPTEAEWEKAARGGLSGALYPWGDTIDKSKANYDWNVGETTPVGRYAPNGYGLYDVCGNVWEWCLDEYDADFYASSARQHPFSGGNLENIISIFTSIRAPRVLRGGSWDDPPAAHLRTALRSASAPETADSFRGFRCVKPIKL